jgi:tetratricopeptide (TPR) repeat protein
MTGFQQSLAVTQAMRALKAGSPMQAEHHCREALKTDRRNVQAMAMLGQILNMSARYDEAAASFQKCIALRPKAPEYHALLAEVRSTQGRYREALNRYDKLLKMHPGYRPGVAGKAEVLNRQGKYEKAMDLIEPWVERGEEDAGIAVGFARVATRMGRYEEAVEVASRHLDDPDVAGEIRRSLFFAVGAAHERNGDFEKAFEAFAKGNELSDRQYDADEDAALIDRLRAAFTAESIAAAPRPASAPAVPIFIVGMMRSGSTLVEQIIDAHPEAHGVGEITDLPEIVASLPLSISSTLSWPECVRDLDGADVERLSGKYLDALRRLGRGAKRVADKQLGNYHHLGLIEILFPGARVIHCRRDPADTCLSCFAQKLPPGKHGYAADLTSLGRAYRQYQRVMEHWRDVLTIPLLEIDYEEIVADQEMVSRRIIDFCGLPWDDRCLRFYESGRVVLTLSSAQVSQPIYASSVGRADRFGQLLAPLRGALAGE